MNFNDVYGFFRNGGGDGAEMPYYFIALNDDDDTALQACGAGTLADVVKMLVLHMEAVRDIINQNPDNALIRADHMDEETWAELLPHLYRSMDREAMENIDL
jgi:hypothetical protein